MGTYSHGGVYLQHVQVYSSLPFPPNCQYYFVTLACQCHAELEEGVGSLGMQLGKKAVAWPLDGEIVKRSESLTSSSPFKQGHN